MPRTLVLVLSALGLLLVGFAGGMYASSLMKPRAISTSPARQAAVLPEVTPSPTMPETTAPSTTTGQKLSVTPSTPPKAAGTPTPAVKPGRPQPNTARPANTPPSSGRPRNAAFEKMRAKMELARLFRGLGRLDELNAPLTAAQAKSILAIMSPLRTQKTLSSDQATKVLAQLQAQLTKAQIAALEQARQRRGPGGNGGPGGFGGPGGNAGPGGNGGPGGDNAGPNQGGPRGPWAGQGGNAGAPGGGDTPPRGPGGAGGPQRGPGGGDPAQFAKQMETMNPFYADSDNPMAQRMTERNKEVFDMLAAKAGK